MNFVYIFLTTYLSEKFVDLLVMIGKFNQLNLILIYYILASNNSDYNLAIQH